MADHIPSAHERLSSWPVRNQRRHIAVVNYNNQILSALSNITDRLDSVEVALSRQVPSFPPGIESRCEPNLSDQIQSLNAKLDVISSSLLNGSKDSFERSGDTILQRIDLLEKIYVLLDWTAIEKAAQKFVDMNGSVHELVSVSSPCQPEPEHSPNKDRIDPVRSIHMDYDTDATIGKPVELFNIFEDEIQMDDKSANVTTQTDSIDSFWPIKETHETGSQTKLRTRGYAVQTTVCTADVATDTSMDVKDSAEAVERYLEKCTSQSTSEDDNESPIPPCILDRRFVDVLLNQMDQLMEAKFANRYA